MESDADTGPTSDGGDAYAASYEAINASLASWTDTDGGGTTAAARGDVRMSLGLGRLSAGTGTARPSFATSKNSTTCT